MNIAIDIGHANGTGAVGNGLEEHAVTSIIAPLLANRLRKSGHTVDIIDYPDKNNTDDLNATVRAVNAGEYGLCISLHCDSASTTEARGAHVCYTSPKGKELAESIAWHLCPLLPGRADATVRRTNLAILNQTRPVSVLCECGFITNPGNAALMQNNPDTIAKAIADGITDHINRQ
ncbi:N-acetylmuramoyl-L-alanine amidase [Akkermansia glycaniphila]|uniref:N-acetylmuramoyl-L-alanine amidase n=1 Tax=Akkermansia glycaniphila TaxID=1679444 RepID=UPI001C019C47|nr:N-acetylmuramoyl-L-alanine amidase [Akkermansia glycaniphila]MBT9449986.1 N-acetylmuramoyl-L-alanine amidase [Akkermansia glycaniphila]